MRCLGASDDAGRFLPFIPPRQLAAPKTTMAIVTQGKARHQSELTWRYRNYFKKSDQKQTTYKNASYISGRN